MHVEVKDPNMKVILSKYYASEGRFTFTSHSPGEHLICLHSNSTRWSLWAGGKLVSESNSVVKILLCVIVLMLIYCTEKHLCSREFTGRETKT